LVISENPEAILPQELGKYFTLKEASMENDVKAWSFSSSQYVQEAVSNVLKYLPKKGKKFPSKAPGAAIRK
jgi:hypothetical protein